MYDDQNIKRLLSTANEAKADRLLQNPRKKPPTGLRWGNDGQIKLNYSVDF